MLTQLEFSDIDGVIAEANAGRTEPEAIAELCRYYFTLPERFLGMADLDPFSDQYRVLVLDVLAVTTGRSSYNAARDEAANYLPKSDVHFVPSIYQGGDSRMLGDFLQAYGSVIEAMGVKRGDSVLEYGAGEGFIAVHLARMGCNVSVVDIEPRYLEIVRNEARSLRTMVATQQGEFGDGPADALFDVILFFEAFHHSLDHVTVLRRIRDRLKPGGRVVFAGEPIIERDGFWSPTLPYAWGPRLDALSLRAMRTYGWCELGYRQDYFIEVLMLAGFLVRFIPCASTTRGSAYIAERNDGLVELGRDILIGAFDHQAEWHGPEGQHRWTAVENAHLPIDQASGWRSISVSMANYLAQSKTVMLELGEVTQRVEMAAGEVCTVTLPLQPAATRLVVRSPITMSEASIDTRCFGVAVQRLTYAR